jgi:hypothetical protein
MRAALIASTAAPAPAGVIPPAVSSSHRVAYVAASPSPPKTRPPGRGETESSLMRVTQPPCGGIPSTAQMLDVARIPMGREPRLWGGASRGYWEEAELSISKPSKVA